MKSKYMSESALFWAEDVAYSSAFFKISMTEALEFKSIELAAERSSIHGSDNGARRLFVVGIRGVSVFGVEISGLGRSILDIFSRTEIEDYRDFYLCRSG